MPTIADYLDDAPKRKTDNFQVDLYYLHVPRAIVKRAADDSPRDILNKLTWGDKVTGGVPTNNLLPEIKDPNYKGLYRLPYYVSNLAGNKNSGSEPTFIEKELGGSGQIGDFLVRRKFWQGRNAPIDETIMGRTWHGDPTLHSIATNLTQKAKENGMPEKALSGLYNVSTQINDHTGVLPGTKFYGPGNAAKTMGGFLDSLVTDEEVENYRKSLNLSDEEIQKYVDAYRDAYFRPEVEANDYKDNFYGWLDQNPGLRGALRYATPWLAYGIPLSAIGSMM